MMMKMAIWRWESDSRYSHQTKWWASQGIFLGSPNSTGHSSRSQKDALVGGWGGGHPNSNCPGNQTSMTQTQEEKVGCAHSQAITVQPCRGVLTKLPQKNCFRGADMKTKTLLALLGNTMAVSTHWPWQPATGWLRLSKTFLCTWHESRPLRGSGSRKLKDQQQKDINPSPKWYFMVIKWPWQPHQRHSPYM